MRKLKPLLAGLVLITSSLQAQNTSDWTNGYYQSGDSTIFLFDSRIYKTGPQPICLTGAFRGWSADLKDPAWDLSPINEFQWKLAVYNKDFSRIKPSMPFKFRTKTGAWLEPSSLATNAEGGNLVFMKGIEPFSISAEIESDARIQLVIKGLESNLNAPFNPAHLQLRDAGGNLIQTKLIQDSLSAGSGWRYIQISPSGNLIDKRRVYFVLYDPYQIKTLCRYDGWFKTLKSNKPLGADVSENGKQTAFRIFAPRATAIRLYLYAGKNQQTADRTFNLTQDENGVWEIILPENLEGVWYDYTVHGFSDPGNFFYETNPVHISDPYARISDDSFGKCRIAKRTIPARPLKKGRPKMENVIAYEVHVEDFTGMLPIADSLKGTFAGMGTSGLRNSAGKRIGFDYLTHLGINTIHLMPVQEMLHWPDDEWVKAFKNDSFMIEQGVSERNYDWGYRTSHSFAIESRYRAGGTDPGAEREQFRDLVQKFHENNIAVIVDFVFNHTAENMDGRSYLFHFNALDKQYYYRTKNLEHIGEYGNETKSENRYMVQRWIIDQCKAFIEEFGVDGFRIDLAGQTDKQTLLMLKAALPKDIIIYGEPWIDSNDPEYNKNPLWHWYKSDAPICYFNDDTRNTYKGGVFELNSKEKDRGWAGGNTQLRDDVKKALTCSFPSQKTITSGINYLDIHDNFTLADQFATYDFDGRYGVDEINYKIAAVLLFTTPGPIVLHGGSEMMRSKGMAILKETEKQIPSGVIYFHGKRDTYNMRNANRFVWDNVGARHYVRKINPTNLPQPYSNADYQGMIEFWQGLMELRTSVLNKLPSYKSDSAQQVAKKITFIEPADQSLLGYIIDGKVLVLLNTGTNTEEIKTSIPRGTWSLVGNEAAVKFDRKPGQYRQQMKGGDVLLKSEPLSIQIWINGNF